MTIMICKRGTEGRKLGEKFVPRKHLFLGNDRPRSCIDGVELEKILFCFENYEGVEIPAEFIISLNITGISNYRRKEGFRKIVLKGKFAEKVYIKIAKTAENILTDFDNRIFERIEQYSDISCIVFKYVDGSEETFTTDWEGICEINDLQKNSLDKDGNFVIRIGKFVDDKNC